jgi:uncharacterized protein with GYD domain
MSAERAITRMQHHDQRWRGDVMSMYLMRASYSPEGALGLIRNGASYRQRAVVELCESVGGTLESMYYAFGDTDVFIIADLPNNTSAAALSLAVNSTGAVKATVTPLLSVEEMDAAAEIEVNYSGPNA